MLKYLQKAYVMSIASYMGADGSTLSATPENNDLLNASESDFKANLDKALQDGNLSKGELLDLGERYDKDKENLKESFMEKRSDEMLQVVATKLIVDNPHGEFENEYEADGDDAIEMDEWFGDKATQFTTEYAELASKFNFDSDDVLRKINELAPGRAELDFTDTVGELISDGTPVVKEAAEAVVETMKEIPNDVSAMLEKTEKVLADIGNMKVSEIGTAISDKVEEELDGLAKIAIDGGKHVLDLVGTGIQKLTDVKDVIVKTTVDGYEDFLDMKVSEAVAVLPNAIGAGIISSANADSTITEGLEDTSNEYTVKKGDTLYGIVKKNFPEITKHSERMKKINEIVSKNDKIKNKNVIGKGWKIEL